MSHSPLLGMCWGCCPPCSPPGWVAGTQGVWGRLPRPFSVDDQLTEKWASYGLMTTPPHSGTFWTSCRVGPLHGTWGPLMPAYCRELGEGWLRAGWGWGLSSGLSSLHRGGRLTQRSLLPRGHSMTCLCPGAGSWPWQSLGGRPGERLQGGWSPSSPAPTKPLPLREVRSHAGRRKKFGN